MEVEVAYEDRDLGSRTGSKPYFTELPRRRIPGRARVFCCPRPSLFGLETGEGAL